jgi:tRNA 2-thiouridine synthesizing protein A
MPRSTPRVILDDVSDSLAWTHSTLCQYNSVCAAFTPRYAGAVVHCISLNMVTSIMSTEPKPAAMAGDMELVELDVTGLNCPMPLLKAKKALNEMQAQQQLRVVATDPGSVKDFEVFARQSGHLLLESTETNGRYSYLLQKKG